MTESYIGMGFTAERVAERWKVTREDQDRFALGSQQKAPRAHGSRKRSTSQIVPVTVEQVAWNGPKKTATNRRVRTRRAAARRHDDGRARQAAARVQGRAARSRRETRARYSDGAAAVLLMSADQAKELGLKPLARFITFADGRRRARRHGHRSDQGGAESDGARRASS